MPLNIQDKLPAKNILEQENIFIMDQSRAIHQDIRPMKIAILNLMPLKISTETHILRVLSNSPLQIEITLLRTKDHVSKHTPIEHLEAFYKTFDEIKKEKYDGLIITGAPIEHLEFEQVNYWDELKSILDWSVDHVTSTLNICWAAQAAMYHLYNIPKHHLNEKLFGVYEHTLNIQHASLTKGFDDIYLAPHSRYTEVRKEDIEKKSDLIIVSESQEAGVYLVMSKDGKQVFVTGHSEYDPDTLKNEYERDRKKGVDVKHPQNYYIDDDPNKAPLMRWRSHANLLYMNWLNYFVYQITPYDLNEIK